MEKKKIALLFVCLNQKYWPYFYQVHEDAQKYFLKNHQVDFFAWTDIPEDLRPKDVMFFETEAVEWPYPTLMRYHLFMQQMETLEKYDYIFYMDADMRIVATVTDEILGQGLTMAEHPMYAVSRKFIPPYEPNSQSSAFIKRLGCVIPDPKTNQRWFKPLYAAGGFQGGMSKEFIEAMRVMRHNIDTDLNYGYIAIWNDESHWNKYLSDYQGHLTVLSPSYVYPDSLIKEYYEPIWGCSYTPVIVTLTKPFTTNKEGADAVRKAAEDLEKLK